MAWVFIHAAELGIDRNRVFLSGHSAGAHIAALTATDPSYFAKYRIAPSMLAGVITVDTASFDLLSPTKERPVKYFISNAFGSDEKVLRSASPLYNITEDSNYPRFLILNTLERKDAAAGARVFADRLKSAGCDVLFIPVEDHSHREMNTGMYKESDPVARAIIDFICNGCR